MAIHTLASTAVDEQTRMLHRVMESAGFEQGSEQERLLTEFVQMDSRAQLVFIYAMVLRSDQGMQQARESSEALQKELQELVKEVKQINFIKQE